MDASAPGGGQGGVARFGAETLFLHGGGAAHERTERPVFWRHRGCVGCGERSLPESAYHLQGPPVSHGAELLAEDVRRVVGGWKVHVQTRTRGGRRRRTDHLRAAPSRDLHRARE